MNRQDRQDNFIHLCEIKHNHKYDYSLVKYINNCVKIQIICPIHGSFYQKPADHKDKKAGCPQCAVSSRIQTNLMKYGVKNPSQNQEIRNNVKQTMIDRYGVGNPSQYKPFKQKAEQTMLNKYGNNDPRWANNVLVKRKQTMLKLYGVEYAAQNHDLREKTKQTCLRKYGTESHFQHASVQEKTKQTCLKKYGVRNASQKHMVNIIPLLENYEWLFDQYTSQLKTTEQIAEELHIGVAAIKRCIKHHEITIRYTVGFSYRCIQWLESIMSQENIHIQHAGAGGEFKIPNTRWKADGYCKKTNTIYEFHGDIWHGNPNVFESTELCHPYSDLTAGELHTKTLEREKHIRSLGYNLVTIWESDFVNSPKL